jgi:hypothetical protein
MPFTVSITEQDLYTALSAFLATVLPAGVVTVQLPINRAPMPAPVPGFVGISTSMQKRIMTNLDRWDQNDPAPASIDIEQAVKFSVKLDCYGADSFDWATMLSTLLRDEYAVTALAPTMAPLYTDDPRFMALTDGEAQYEKRWIVLAQFQYNPVITTPMQFMDAAAADLINVDVSYPP